MAAPRIRKPLRYSAGRTTHVKTGFLACLGVIPPCMSDCWFRGGFVNGHDMFFVSISKWNEFRMLYGKHPPVNCKTIIWLSLIYHRWVFPWKPPFSSGISQRISSMTGPTRRDSRRYDACAATRTLEVATKNDSQLFGSVRVGSNGMCGGFGQRQLGWKRAQIHKSVIRLHAV
jgi:hypothetical protein